MIRIAFQSSPILSLPPSPALCLPRGSPRHFTHSKVMAWVAFDRAVAIVVRSIGTDHHRNPHTGVQYFTDGATPIPAGALTVPDS